MRDAELSLQRLDAQDAGVGALERVEHFARRRRQRTRRDLLDQHGVGGGAGIIERGRQARGDLAAGLVGDERDALARLDGEADLTALRAPGASSGENGPKTVACRALIRLDTTKAGTCPPPDVTFASPVALSRVRKPATRPRKT